MILVYYYFAILGLWIHLTFSLICSLPSSSLSYHLVSGVGRYRREVRSRNAVPANSTSPGSCNRASPTVQEKGDQLGGELRGLQRHQRQ